MLKERRKKEERMEVESDDVIRIIIQFLEENGLKESSTALRKESGVALNVVKNKQAVVDAVASGKWAQALELLGDCELSDNVGWKLYEEMLGDLVCSGEAAAAKVIVLEAPELLDLKSRDGARFDTLQDLVFQEFSKARQQAKEKWENRHSRWERLAAQVESQLIESDPSKLLELIGNGLQWRHKHGLDTSLLGRNQVSKGSKRETASSSPVQRTGKRERSGDEVKEVEKEVNKRPRKAKQQSTMCEKVYAKIKLGESRVHAMCFGNKHSTLATGTTDGIIELWNHETGKLRRDLAYQARDEVMMHKKGILSLAFSSDDSSLVSSSVDGTIKVWDVETGKAKTKIKRAHLGKPVNCVLLSSDSTKVLSGGDDHRVRIFGVQSGNMLVEFAGHESQVTSVTFLGEDQSRVASSSSDHTIRLWDAKTGRSLTTIKLSAPVNNVVAREGMLLACARTGVLTLVDVKDTSLPWKELAPDANLPQPSAFLQAVATSSGFYALSEDGAILYLEGDAFSQLRFRAVVPAGRVCSLISAGMHVLATSSHASSHVHLLE